jgi:histidinol dehydrogenase
MVEGIMVGQIVRPLERVGIYVPGGTASYPSSVVMTAIPAQAAGVPEIVACSPPGRTGPSPEVLVAARECGISRFFKVGGAQAIAALAYGTHTIPRVQKIIGPGNKYVTEAKKRVYGLVDIDCPAGPSEVAIIADEYARADWIAADMVAQAEHDPDANVVLFSTSSDLIQRVDAEIRKKELPRQEISRSALDRGVLVTVSSLDAAVDAVNQYAPEHLGIFAKEPFCLLERIKNAGAIFLGGTSPVALGDYAAGPSHVLPTSGAARSFSALSPQSFLKISNVIHCAGPGNPAFEAARILAEHEGLPGHALSLKVRNNIGE